MLFRSEAITDIDVTGAKAFREVVEWLASQHVTLHLSRVRPDLLKVLHRFDLRADLKIHGTNRQALQALSRDD